MLSQDLAELYEVETRVLNQQVKRNIGKFPERYMFQLTREEFLRIKSQNVSLKRGQHVGVKAVLRLTTRQMYLIL